MCIHFWNNRKKYVVFWFYAVLLANSKYLDVNSREKAIERIWIPLRTVECQLLLSCFLISRSDLKLLDLPQPKIDRDLYTMSFFQTNRIIVWSITMMKIDTDAKKLDWLKISPLVKKHNSYPIKLILEQLNLFMS